ncbi:unnamed protein product [Bursaphelenchus okinawaensis]|uniref:F-box domain-containing protein n=1 Tax=Bursaphelenchus okinawaensis TaxID=465554 RepID=A0A811KUB1_9BILA|nr:unnamed protein product [Bursaphelenchus okinawaensis]CAG9112095.1 unnamed protein product [Bursaphelenchus okinawaensis]
MRVLVVLGGERRKIEAVDQLNYGAVKGNIRQIFGFDSNVNFVLKLGESAIELNDDQFLAEAGVVSGEILKVHVIDGKIQRPQSSNSQPTTSTAETNKKSVPKPSEVQFSNENVKKILVDQLISRCQMNVENENSPSFSDNFFISNIMLKTKVTPWSRGCLNLTFVDKVHAVANLNLQLISDKGIVKQFGVTTVYPIGFRKQLDAFCANVEEFLYGPKNKFLSTFFFGSPQIMACALCKHLDPESLLRLSVMNKYMRNYCNGSSFDVLIWKEMLARYKQIAVGDVPALPEGRTHRKELIAAITATREENERRRRMQEQHEHDLLMFDFPRNRREPMELRQPGLDEFDRRWQGGEVFPNHRPRRDPANPLIIPRPGHPDFQPDFNPDPDMPQGPSRGRGRTPPGFGMPFNPGNNGFFG